MKSLDEFKEIADRAIEKIRKNKPDVLDWIRTIYYDNELESICFAREGATLSCSLSNRKIFHLRNTVPFLPNSSYEEKEMKKLYKYEIEIIGNPVINVLIPDGDGYFKFAVDCPFAGSESCVLKDFKFKTKEEEEKEAREKEVSKKEEI